MRKNEYLYMIKKWFFVITVSIKRIDNGKPFFISESDIDRPEDYSENFVLQEQELIRCTKNDRWIYTMYIKIYK